MNTMRCFVALIVILLVSAAPVAQSPQTLPRVQVGDLKRLGTFNVPWDCGGSFFSYGGGGMGIAANNGLFLAAYDQHRQVGEITIPALGGTATVRTPCSYPHGIEAIKADALVGGLLLWNNRVIVSGYSAYDADGTARLSHGAVDLGTGSRTPFVQVGTMGGGYVGGAMAIIPQEWRALLGGSALTGQASISIISRTSSGPSAFVFNPDDIGRVNPVPATPLVTYPLSNPLAPHVAGARNDLYTRIDEIGGIAFPSGTRSVLFIGRHADGPINYGEVPPLVDPTNNYKGDHAYPYSYRVWAYDANDLLRVKQGQLQPWQVKPYAYWKLAGIEDTGRATIRPGGATYDPATRRLYIAAPRWGDPALRIHVYEIGKGSPSPPLVEICGDGIDNDGDGLIDEGCPVTSESHPFGPITVPVGARTITVAVPVMVGGVASTIQLPVSVPASTTTVSGVCTKPAGGTWTCLVQ